MFSLLDFLFFLLYFAVSWVFWCWCDYLIFVIMLNLRRQFDLADATCGSFFNNDVFVWAWCCPSWLLMSFDDDLSDDIVINDGAWCWCWSCETSIAHADATTYCFMIKTCCLCLDDSFEIYGFTKRRWKTLLKSMVFFWNIETK